MIPEISTIDGRMYNYLTPDPDVVTIEAIAAATSKQCRFGGHVVRFYSVAEHMVRGSYHCEDPLSFLLHDGSEFVVIDVPTPLKMLLGSAYAEIEDRVQDIIDAKWGTDVRSAAVKRTDLVMLATERADLKLPGPPWPMLEGIEPITSMRLASQSGRPETWERRYLERFAELTQ